MLWNGYEGFLFLVGLACVLVLCVLILAGMLYHVAHTVIASRLNSNTETVSEALRPQTFCSTSTPTQLPVHSQHFTESPPHTRHNVHLPVHVYSHHNTDSPSRIQHESQSFASPRLRSRSLPSHPDATSTEELSPERSDILHNFRRNRSPPSLPPHSSRSVTLPDFWSTNLVGCFNAIELLFQDSGITAESTKYALLITALSRDKTTLARVTDIFQQLNAESPIHK